MTSRRDDWNVGVTAIAPLAFLGLLALAYWVVPPAHEPGRQLLLQGMHAGALVIALVGLGLCIHDLYRTAGTADARIVQRRRFVAVAGILGAAISVLLIIGMAIPTLMLWPGAEP